MTTLNLLIVSGIAAVFLTFLTTLGAVAIWSGAPDRRARRG